MDENVLSWNIPNWITVVLMVTIVWGAIGLGGSFLFRPKAAPRG